MGDDRRRGRWSLVEESGIGQIVEGVKRFGKRQRDEISLREIVLGLEADEGAEPLGGSKAKEEAVKVDDVVESVLISPFAQDHAGFLVAIGALQAHPPAMERLDPIGIGEVTRQVPGFRLPRVPYRQEADRNAIILAVEGQRAKGPLARANPADGGRGTAQRQALSAQFRQTDVGLRIEANDERASFGLMEAEGISPGEAAVSDSDPVKGGGEEGEEVVDEFLLDLVLTEEGERFGLALPGFAGTTRARRVGIARIRRGRARREAGFQILAMVRGQADRETPTPARDGAHQQREGVEVHRIEENRDKRLAATRRGVGRSAPKRELGLSQRTNSAASSRRGLSRKRPSRLCRPCMRWAGRGKDRARSERARFSRSHRAPIT